MIEIAVKAGVLTYNPVREVTVNKNLVAKYTKDKVNEEEFFSYEEVKTFLDYAELHELYELYYMTVFFGLRSSCVSILVHEGYDIKSIQKWVGHADIDTTLRIYAKVKDKESKREISDGLNNLIQPKKYSNRKE